MGGCIRGDVSCVRSCAFYAAGITLESRHPEIDSLSTSPPCSLLLDPEACSHRTWVHSCCINTSGIYGVVGCS
jgi:hypothetical protein